MELFPIFFLAARWGWDAVVHDNLEDDQVLFQYRDLNDRVYYYIAAFWGPNSERIDAVLSDKRSHPNFLTFCIITVS
jgi:hypothetical protein